MDFEARHVNIFTPHTNHLHNARKPYRNITQNHFGRQGRRVPDSSQQRRVWAWVSLCVLVIAVEE